jgi:hypothetical protein
MGVSLGDAWETTKRAAGKPRMRAMRARDPERRWFTPGSSHIISSRFGIDPNIKMSSWDWKEKGIRRTVDTTAMFSKLSLIINSTVNEIVEESQPWWTCFNILHA